MPDSDLSGPAIQAALAAQQQAAPPVQPLPMPRPVDPGSAQLGAGLQMPAYSAPVPSAPTAPLAPHPTAPAPLARSADLAANASTARAAQEDVDRGRRARLVSELEREGARPGAAKADATRLDRERPRAVPSPYAQGASGGAGGGADLQGQLRGAFGDAYRPPGKDYGPAKEALGMTEEWRQAHDAELAAADEGERRAQENAAEQYRIGQEKQAHIQGTADAQDVLAKEEAAKQAAHANEVARKTAEVERLQDDAANDRIDPSRIWKDNPASAALAALGAVAGGIQTAYTHGPNQALEMINRMVDRDVDAQKEAHAFKRERAGAGDRMLDKLREQGLDEAGQRAAMRNMALSKSQLGLQAIAATSDNQQFKSNADRLHSAIEAEKARNQATMAQSIGQTQYAIDHPKPLGGGGGSGDGLKVAEANVEKGRIVGDLEGKESIPGYTLTDRLRHLVADKTGLDVERDEAKGTRADVDELVARKLKAEGRRVNDEATGNYERRFVKNEEDVRKLSRDTKRDMAAREELAATKRGGAPTKRKPVDVEEEDDDKDR